MRMGLLRRIYLTLLLFAGTISPALAQYDLVTDSVLISDEQLTLQDLNASPKRALLWSIIPGGGQVYNGAWWKVPIVYGGLLGIVAVADYSQNLYTRYNTAIEQRCLGDGYIIVIPYADCIPTPNEPGLAEYPTDALIRAKNGANRRRQTAYVFVIAGYVLQAVEAFTDAHLQNFDIDDDLSLRLGPVSSPDAGTGVGITIPLGTGRQRLRQYRQLSQLTSR